MKRNYKVFLTSLIIFPLITFSDLNMFGVLDAEQREQREQTECKPDRIDWECIPREPPIPMPCPDTWYTPGVCEAGQRPDIQPKPICPKEDLISPCPLDAAKSQGSLIP